MLNFGPLAKYTLSVTREALMRIIELFCKNLGQLNEAIERFGAKSRQQVVAHQEQKAPRARLWNVSP